MNFDALKNHPIKLFGKSRALSKDEFEKQLLQHDITLQECVNAETVLIIEGRMLNPIEQLELDKLYEHSNVKQISIDLLEQWLCEQIKDETLLMSLKLSSDRERLMGFLQNPLISHALFLKLLKLYNWQGEGFFESDDNRDITAALISRFYENIERNHNVQYANMGIMHLLHQSSDRELLETIAMLEPLQLALKNGCDNSTQKILSTIAVDENTTTKVLNQWLKKGNADIQVLIALRDDLTLQMQQYLINLKRSIINETLSLNHHIDQSIALTLLDAYPANIAKHIRLDTALFEQLLEDYAEALASNESLSIEMQKKLLEVQERTRVILAQNSTIDVTVFSALLETKENAVIAALFSNKQMHSVLIEQLFEEDAERFAEVIAANEKTPTKILETLATSHDVAVLLALAKNRATPIEILYQFQLDSRLARAVKENESFGKHIQRNSIGWDV